MEEKVRGRKTKHASLKLQKVGHQNNKILITITSTNILSVDKAAP